MFSTRTIVRTALFVLVFISALTITTTKTTHAWEFPFFGKIPFGSSDDPSDTALRLDVLFGYRSTPQFYTVAEDTVEIRALVVNNENDEEKGVYETKIYRLSSVWDTKTHSISYDQRFDNLNAGPEDEALTFGESTLRDIFFDTQDCGIRVDQFCYQEQNAEDSDYPFGGLTFDPKPVFVTISDELTIAPNERFNLISQWKPESCGYYRIVVQPFGYIEEFGTENKTRDAYVRVKGCDENGEILDEAAVNYYGASPETGIGAALGEFTDIDHLPLTSLGLIWYLIPAFGLMLGGAMVSRGTKSIK